MNSTKRFMIGASAVAAAWMLLHLTGVAEEKPESTPKKESDEESVVMKQKLRHTHALLTSLAREDFPGLENNAQDLRRIAHQQWEANPTPEYRAQLQVFWTILDAIETGAQRKDIEETTLAYMQMTLSCVKCHKVIRRERRRE